MLKTLDVYDGTVDFLRELELDDDTLAKAIIGTIGDVDSYQLPDAKGYSRYGNTLPICPRSTVSLFFALQHGVLYRWSFVSFC